MKGSLSILRYKDVLLEYWVDLFSFQVYDWVINFPLQYIDGWGFLRYDISIAAHISTSPCSFFIAKRNSSITML